MCSFDSRIHTWKYIDTHNSNTQLPSIRQPYLQVRSTMERKERSDNSFKDKE